MGEIKDGQRHGKGSLTMNSKLGEVILEVTDANWCNENPVDLC